MLWSCASDQLDQEESDQYESDQQQEEQEQQQEQDEDDLDDEDSEDLQEINDLSDQTLGEEGTSDYGNADSLDNVNDLAGGLEDTEQSDQGLSDEALGNDLQGAYDGNLNPVGGDVVTTMSEPIPSMGDAPTDSSDRVVRYVTADGTPVYDRPDPGASSLSTLYQGDPLVVAIQGEWAEITPGRYVMTSSLSEKIVPRLQGESPWGPPSGPQP